jgi:hypothetical protein
MSDFRYMMATRAETSHGQDISRDEPALARIYGEEDCCLIGEWVTGVGYINVHFARQTTRPLTEAEQDYYRGMVLDVAGIISPLDIEGHVQ